MNRRSLLTAILLGVMASAGRAQTLTDFGFNASPLPASRPVLLILPSYPGLTVSGTSLQWHQLLFDTVTSNSPPRFSVAGWASETSNGRFTITPASFAVAVTMTAADSFNAIQAANPSWNELQVNNVWIGRIVKALIDSGFDFPAFDTNHNGNVECPSELTICIINPATGNYGGVNRDMATQQDGAGTFSVSGRSIIAGHEATFDTIIHEFGHSFGIPYEMYTPTPSGGTVNNGMAIMSSTGGGSAGATQVFSATWAPGRLHFDPWHKMRFGWSEPRIVSLRAGGRVILPVATSRTVSAPVILYDPLRGTNEFFVLEYRSRFQSAANYDNDFGVETADGEGLVIWQVATQPNHSVFGNWTPGDPALNPPALYSSSILCRCPLDLNVTANRPWISEQETPALKWFDGSATSTRIHVLPFAAGATSITVEILAEYDTWTDFSYLGLPFVPETGGFNTPYNSFAEGTANVGYGGRLRIKASQTNETIANLDKQMTVEAFGGTVTIGHFP
jgi:M6 family metalloprotease-like protein